MNNNIILLTSVWRQLKISVVLILTILIIILIPVIHRIPYLNIFSHEVLFGLITFDMFFLLACFQISFRQVFISFILLLITMYALQLLSLSNEAEYIGNIIYLLLVIGCIREFFYTPYDK